MTEVKSQTWYNNGRSGSTIPPSSHLITNEVFIEIPLEGNTKQGVREVLRGDELIRIVYMMKPEVKMNTSNQFFIDNFFV